MFELIAIRLFGFFSKCHSVPFAALERKNDPSPQGSICQNLELSDMLAFVISGTVFLVCLPGFGS